MDLLPPGSLSEFVYKYQTHMLSPNCKTITNKGIIYEDNYSAHVFNKCNNINCIICLEYKG